MTYFKFCLNKPRHYLIAKSCQNFKLIERLLFEFCKSKYTKVKFYV